MTNLKFWLKLGVLFLPLFFLSLLVIEVMIRYTVDQQNNRQRMILCVVSLLCNLPVLYVHFCYPPHPKYLILPLRRFGIRVHVFSGSIEFLTAVAAFTTLMWFGSDYFLFSIFARVMACAALIGHVPSSIYQMRIVFGVRAIMLPSYVLCIGLHGYCAAWLLADPSPFWLYNTFLAFNVYAWVRVFYYLFNKLNLFPGSSYTLAVLFAGVMLGPALLGPAAILFLMVFIFVFDGVYWLAFRNTGKLHLFLRERERNTYRSEELRQLWSQLLLEKVVERGERLTDREKAKRVFDSFDKDESEELSREEIDGLLSKWKVRRKFRLDLVDYLTDHGNRGVDFERFYRFMWCFGNAQWLQGAAGEERDQIKDPADFVFDLIDLDKNGRIDPFELQVLLTAWGLPADDVDKCLAEYRAGRDIDKKEFREKMSPIWKFAYCDVIGLCLQKQAWHMS